MILKGSQRGGAQQLAVHLLRQDENEHVELHEIRGFVANDLAGALREAYAISKGTRCQQFMFSLILSPPEKENVPIKVFKDAIGEIETKLGLTGQPRAIVFHEKLGRRHAHCVWSRIDADAMKAINLPHFKLKLRDVSRELYIEHGWQMPAGLVNSAERNPTNFTRAEWQQAKRAEQKPQDLKALFQDCWAISDSRKAFAQALAARGYYLAKGERRAFVAVDVRGEVFSIARWVGLPTKRVRERLGEPDDLPTVAATKATIGDLLKGTLGRHLAESKDAFEQRLRPLAEKRVRMTAEHRQDRNGLRATQKERTETEAQQRSARYRSGIRGLWDRLTGRHVKLRKQNDAEAAEGIERDAGERQTMIERQLAQRRGLQRELVHVREAHARETEAIHRDFTDLPSPAPQLTPRSTSPDPLNDGPRRRRKHEPSL